MVSNERSAADAPAVVAAAVVSAAAIVAAAAAAAAAAAVSRRDHIWLFAAVFSLRTSLLGGSTFCSLLPFVYSSPKKNQS